MLSIALPSLPPPATSLLPLLHDQRSSDSTNNSDGQNPPQTQQQQQQQRRARGSVQNMYARSHLAILANEERILEQRKQAISTYGYSWLKPAGCTKTMLGRREEEIEREEVERQLREVEMQERNNAEVEEAERMAQQEQQRAREERGEVITGEEGDRDLDEEVPDMDAEYGDEDEDDEGDEDEEDEEADLDDDIPEGDSGYAYDTTRDPDTESEDSDFATSSRPGNPQGQRQGFPSDFGINDRQRDEGDSTNHQTLEDDELDDHGEDQDLDDDVPDMDEEARDLDDEVPDADADDDDGGWEHTDTELEESDMDISIMPPGVITHQNSMLPPPSNQSQARRYHQQRQTHMRQSTGSQQSDIEPVSNLRRTSGNVLLPQPPSMAPPSSSSHHHINRRGLAQPRQPPPNFTPAQLNSDISVSALISTGNSGASSLVDSLPGGTSQRTWLNPASARRNLFGANNRLPHTQSFDGVSSRGPTTSQPSNTRTLGAIPNLTRSQSGPAQTTDGMVRQVSSGGLFTPEQQSQQQGSQRGGVVEEPRSRTRSGRLLGAIRGHNRAG